MYNSHNNSSDIPNGYDEYIWIEGELLVEVGLPVAVVGVVVEVSMLAIGMVVEVVLVE